MTEKPRRKEIFCVRMSTEIRAKVRTLRDKHYGTWTETVAVAVERLWAAHFGERTSADVENEQ